MDLLCSLKGLHRLFCSFLSFQGFGGFGAEKIPFLATKQGGEGQGCEPPDQQLQEFFQALGQNGKRAAPPGTEGVSKSVSKTRRRAEYGFGEYGFKHQIQLFALAEFRGENSVSSSQPIICVTKRTHRVFRRTHRVFAKTQGGSVSSLL